MCFLASERAAYVTGTNVVSTAASRAGCCERFRIFTPRRLLVLGLVVLAVALGLAVYPSNEYIFLPDPAHAVAPLVTVPGGHAPKSGGVYFVDVIVRKATSLERLFGGLHRGATSTRRTR